MSAKNPSLQFEDLQSLLTDQPQGHEKAFDLSYYIDLILRRRWIMIGTFVIAMLVGIYLAMTLTKIYQAETLILIEPQALPGDYVRPIVSSDFGAKVSTINEMVNSRTNLMKIMDKFSLFPETASNKMFLDEKIESLRNRTSVDIAGRNANAITIAFKGKDPELVMNVVNAMAQLVITQNVQARETQALGAVEFLDEELENMRNQLEAVESKLSEFRINHMGELPEQLASNLTVLERLQQQLSEKQKSLREEKYRLTSLNNQIQLVREQVKISGTKFFEDSGLSELEALKKQMAEYNVRYTPQHPDVVQLTKKIAELEEAEGRANQSAARSDRISGSANQIGASPTGGLGLRQEAELVSQLSMVMREIAAINKDISSIEDQINTYQLRVENTPKVEQELISLKRDYDNIQNTYSSLLDRKQEATIATNMEQKQKGEQFRILDPARIPDKPQSPDMRKLFLICVMAGLGFGCGLIFVFEYFDESIKKPDTIPDKLKVPLLVVMPSIKFPKDVRKRRINDIFSVLATLICFSLLGLFAAVSVLGMSGPTEFVKKLIT